MWSITCITAIVAPFVTMGDALPNPLKDSDNSKYKYLDPNS